MIRGGDDCQMSARLTVDKINLDWYGLPLFFLNIEKSMLTCASLVDNTSINCKGLSKEDQTKTGR